MIKTSLKILLIHITAFFLQSCTIEEMLDFYLDPTGKCSFTGQTFNDREECEKNCDEGCVGETNR